VPITRIQRTLSTGVLGIGNNRKIVPTRWSITAVDSSISLKLINEIKNYDTINEYQVYHFKNLDNIFISIFIPRKWSFEWIEAWFPGTVWNFSSRKPSLMGDYEPYWGSSTYASVGGCYYSARLAAAEKLSSLRKQATALILREIHPGYILPVGVWNVRESIRKSLSMKPVKFDNFQAALKYAVGKLTIPNSEWLEKSTILREMLFQKKITDFT
jgi:hypothetical protein